MSQGVCLGLVSVNILCKEGDMSVIVVATTKKTPWLA